MVGKKELMTCSNAASFVSPCPITGLGLNLRLPPNWAIKPIYRAATTPFPQYCPLSRTQFWTHQIHKTIPEIHNIKGSN